MLPSWLPNGHIEIKGLKIYAHHGVDPQETLVGNNFEVDITLEFPCEHAMRTDRLDLTISYAEVIDIVKAEMAFPSKLIENVVYRIYEALTYRYTQISSGRIAIYKLTPPISAELDRVGFVYHW